MSPATRRVKRNRIGRGLTFEKVWATLERNAEEAREERKETDRLMKETRESQQETDRLMKETRESQQETARQMKETDRKFQEVYELLKEHAREMKEDTREINREIKEAERIVKAVSWQMGGLHNSFGEMAEFMVAPGVADLFNEIGFHITESPICNRKIKDENKRTLAEIDLLMGNGDYVIAVEVKTSLGEKDIEEHRKRLEILHKQISKTGDRRKILGGMAVAVPDEDSRKAILDAGFYLIVPSGDYMKLDLPEGFVPMEF